jgi:prepilin-type N-terminal cleavage/methylation domain-containing protein
MDFKNTFTKSRERSGFTLVEVLITSAIALVVAAAISLLYMFSSRAFLTLNNYTDMCERSQLALDKMSKDIRQAKQVTDFTTNGITFQDVNGNPLQYTYDPTAKTLSRLSGGKTTTYLTSCDALQFWIYLPSPTSNSFTCYSPAYVTNARVIQITWNCSRLIRGQKTTTESMESAQIAMRNH